MLSHEVTPDGSGWPKGRPHWVEMPGSADRIEIAPSRQTTAALDAIAMLYDTSGGHALRRVDMDAYVASLVGHLSRASLVDRGIMIRMSCALGHADASTARDIGFTLVNLVTICVTHGLRRRPGLIAIAAIRSSRHIRLRVSDDGTGELDPFDPVQRDAFEAVRTHAVRLDARVKVFQRPTKGSSMTVTASPSGPGRSRRSANRP